MAIEDIPTWSFAPNWSSDVRETLAWLTDVLVSPTGAEQRRALRKYPRRTFEFSIVASENERSLLENFTSAYGGNDFYLPIWHDVNIVVSPISIGANAIANTDLITSDIREGDIICFKGDSAFTFELKTVSEIDGDSVTFEEVFAQQWPAGTYFFIVRKSRLTEQPALKRLSDNTSSAQVRFMTVQPAYDVPRISDDFELSNSYDGFAVLSIGPDERDTLDYGSERIFEDLDNETGTPLHIDRSNIPFIKQRYNWVLNGRQQLGDFRKLIYDLSGRCKLIWMPTFFADFRLYSSTLTGASSIVVHQTGFTQTGGPRETRRHIAIRLMNGTIYYRRITSSISIDEAREVLTLDQNLPDAFAPTDVLQISFMALVRLDQDQVEILHKSDSFGVTTATTTFRSVPNIRTEEDGF